MDSDICKGSFDSLPHDQEAKDFKQPSFSNRRLLTSAKSHRDSADEVEDSMCLG